MKARGYARRTKRLAAVKSRSLDEIKLNPIAVAVNRVIQVHSLAFDLDVGVIKVPFTCDLTLPSIDALKQFRIIAIPGDEQ
jgi:hypothetical protein